MMNTNNTTMSVPLMVLLLRYLVWKPCIYLLTNHKNNRHKRADSKLQLYLPLTCQTCCRLLLSCSMSIRDTAVTCPFMWSYSFWWVRWKYQHNFVKATQIKSHQTQTQRRHLCATRYLKRLYLSVNSGYKIRVPSKIPYCSCLSN